MDLHPVAQRIHAQVPAIIAVGLAGDFQTALANLRIQTPAAFVLPGPERAGRNEHINTVQQQVAVQFSVAMAIQNLRDMQGDAAQTDLDGVRAALMSCLLGWTPGTSDSPITFVGGRILKWADGVLWWADDFATTTYVRAV